MIAALVIVSMVVVIQWVTVIDLHARVESLERSRVLLYEALAKSKGKTP